VAPLFLADPVYRFSGRTYTYLRIKAASVSGGVLSAAGGSGCRTLCVIRADKTNVVAIDGPLRVDASDQCRIDGCRLTAAGIQVTAVTARTTRSTVRAADSLHSVIIIISYSHKNKNIQDTDVAF